MADTPAPANVPATASADRRRLHFLAGLAISSLALWLAFFVQDVRPNPFAPRSWWSWVAYPSEVNSAARLPEFTGDLYGLHVSEDGRTIWFVGARRTVAVSRDAGRHWEKIALQPFPGEGVEPQKPPEDPKQDLKKGDRPSKASVPVPPHIFGMQNPPPPKNDPPRRGPLPPPVGSALTAVSFTPDGTEGWIVGTHGVMFHSTDGGKNWAAIRLAATDELVGDSNPQAIDFVAVRAISPGNATMVDSLGCRLSYSAAISTWTHTRRTSFPTGGAWIDAEGFPWLAGWDDEKTGPGRLLKYSGPDLVRVDAVPSPASAHPLRAVTRAPDDRVWAVGDSGTILEVVGKSVVAHALPNGDKATLRAVAFADARRGVVGGDQALAYTTDGGTTWKPAAVVDPSLPPPSDPWVRALWLSDDDGWAVGTGGLILRTADAGATWHPFIRPPDFAGRPVFLPAPWLYLALLVAAWFFARATFRVDPDTVEAVDDSLTPDRPLEPGDRDVLELGGIARALSRFFRNEKTLPPLTAAVLGKWGTGKSSLMNLLKKDLEARGFCPVWFNAWHHSTKKEDELLAGLLANVIRQGLPPWFSVAGVVFRAKLVWGRLRKIWLRLVLGVSLTAAAVAHFDTVKALENTSLAKLAEEFRKAPDDSAVAFGLGGLAGAFFLLQAARRGLQSFGIDAGALLPGVTSQTNLSALDAKASFRLTFATQFREVTAALNPRTLVVFIDDLDRCRPENVLEVMESINFLSSSGDCFIVLGMDWDYVLRSVALGFEKVADAMSDAVPGADDVRSKRLAFAKSYLEKLVNFDIPVPTPDAAKREEFLLPKAAAVAPPPPPRRFDFPAWTARLTTLAMLAALIAVPLAVYSWAKPRPGPSAAFAGAVAPVGPVTVGTDGRNTKQPSPPPNAPTTFAPSPPQSSTILLWGALGVTGVLIGVGVVGLLRNPGVVVRDSGAFTRALGLWIGPITARRHTARSLKQFINRLRYCAARMRVEGAEPSRWERLLWALGVRSRPGPSARQSSQEADLVQWSVLNEVCPAALDGTAPVPDDVAELVARHASLFARPADEREQERRYFRHLAAGFRTDTGRSPSDRAAPDS